MSENTNLIFLGEISVNRPGMSQKQGKLFGGETSGRRRYLDWLLLARVSKGLEQAVQSVKVGVQRESPQHDRAREL